jgi:hypothetical protein
MRQTPLTIRAGEGKPVFKLRGRGQARFHAEPGRPGGRRVGAARRRGPQRFTVHCESALWRPTAGSSACGLGCVGELRPFRALRILIAPKGLGLAAWHPGPAAAPTTASPWVGQLLMQLKPPTFSLRLTGKRSSPISTRSFARDGRHSREKAFAGGKHLCAGPGIQSPPCPPDNIFPAWQTSSRICDWEAESLPS